MTYIAPSVGGSYVRSPRVWLAINGLMLPCTTATVTRKSERSCDSFSAELPIDLTALAGFGYPEWADYQPVDVEILMAENALDQPTSVITGQIDEPEIDWGEQTVHISGRDKGAALTEYRRSNTFLNQQSSDIVSTIAQDYGLTPQVTPGSDFAGKFYDVDSVHLVLNLSDAEVLNRLAQREGYRWYVDGTNLVFEPRGTDSDTFTVVWVPPNGMNTTGYATCTDLKTRRNMTAAKPHQHTLKSFHHRDKKLYTTTTQADGVGQPVIIEHHHNGRRQSEIDKISASRLQDAIRHDCNVVVKAPGDLTVTPRQKLNLTGTGTIFDQLYDIDSVEFTIGWQEGFEMTIEGKIAKSGRTGTDDSGSTAFTSNVPLPPQRPTGP